MEFAQRAKALFDKGNLTQRELAEICGVSESMISRYLSGAVTPKEDIARKILEALGADEPKIDIEGADDMRAALTMLSKVYEDRIADIWKTVADLKIELRTEKREKWTFFVLLCVVVTFVFALFWVDLTNGKVGWYRY